jgi:hypothetical protein
MMRSRRILAVLAWLWIAGIDASALTITTPAPGTTVSPGAAITIQAAPAPGEVFSEVVFVMPGAQTTTEGALQATLAVPADAVGPTPIGVIGIRADGTAETAVVTVTVEPGALRRVSLEIPAALTRIGQVVQADIQGLFADGVTRDLSGPDRGSTYASSNDAVLAVHAAGVFQARSRGTAVVTVSNRGRSAQVTVAVEVPSPADNGIPVPDAGSDQAVSSGVRVNLSAAGSSDPDGDALTYHWTQMAGPLLFLWNETSAQAHFVAPRVAQPVTIEFALVVIDAKGAISFPDTVRIIVMPSMPVANQ